MEGNCCTFNYIRKRDVQSLKADSPGSALGLIAVIYPDINDYFYPLYNTEGFNVHVFNPRDFPDTPSGGLLEKIISLRTEMFLRIDASTVHSVPDVGHFSVKQRGCIFNNDNTNIMYSFSDCLTLCRIRSIRALCGCKIFYYPKDDDLSATEDADVPPCTLQHIPCLNKYKVKWRTQKPTEGNLEGLEHELEDSISCPHCIPACSSTSYFAQSTWAPIMRNEFQQSNFLGGLELTNHSILRVYFGTSNTLLYRKDVLYYWYEIISNFGGIGGLFVGFSLMSLVEFVYYFTVEFYQNLRHTSESAVMKTPIKLSRRIKEDVFIKTDYDEIVLSKQLFRNKNKMYKNNFNTRYFE